MRVLNVADEQLPPEPLSAVVPYLHYGAIGLNALKGYDAAVFIHGYYIPDAVLTTAMFAYLPPSQRPRPRISAKGGRRRITWSGVIGGEDKKLAEIALFRLEADPALQAFGRVRYTTDPRTVVMSIQHNILPRLGRVTTVSSLTAARLELGLGGTSVERHKHDTERLRSLLNQGETLTVAAAGAGIPYRSAKRLAAAADLQLNRGRQGGIAQPEGEKGPNSLYKAYKVGLAPFSDAVDTGSSESATP